MNNAKEKLTSATSMSAMKRIFSMTLEEWNTVLKFGSAVLLGLTFAVGALTIFTSHILSKRQAVELERLRKAQEPRQLDTGAFIAALKDTPKCDVEILYQPEDPEAHLFAMQIFMGVVSGWQPANPLKSWPRPIPPNFIAPHLRELPPKLLQGLPPMSRIALSPFGVSVIAKKSPSEAHAPRTALRGALRAGGIGFGMSSNSDMPDDLLLIVVGPKP